MLKILIVDDQKTVQALLNDYLENEPSLEIIGFAENGQDALEMVKVHRPDIVLMDIEMPVLDGLSATRIIAEQFIQSSVLILTVHDEDTYLNAALQVGAKGYLLKNTPAKELINAIYSAHKGYFQLGPGLLEKYLYKISQLKSDFQEFQELKTIISQQSNLLNQLRSEPKPSNSSSEATTNNAQLQNEIFTLKQKLYYLHSHIDEFKKRFLYLQNLVFLLIFTVTILILIMYFS
ncbi:MAG: response regulator transcription factor [Xenococcaceae cyanobacterium MO_167.B27]|nr:response regulator transcription factor [Xenococcaceae cyanobacterium MO_167.B27]